MPTKISWSDQSFLTEDGDEHHLAFARQKSHHDHHHDHKGQQLQLLLHHQQQEVHGSNHTPPTERYEVQQQEQEEGSSSKEEASAAAKSLLLRQEQVARRMRILTFIAAIGGFLSGYNTGVIAGALLPLKRVFALTEWQEELIVSATIVSAFLASLAGGTINTYVGRRQTLLLAAVIFTMGGCLMLVAWNYTLLVAGEILLGIGIGLESLTSPLYIAEVAKPSIRGMLVSAYALMMCCGQFVAGILDGVYGELLPEHWAWRCMFGTAMLPGVAMFVGFLGLPESPSWLMSKCLSKEEEARSILQSVRDTDQEVDMELKSLRETARSITTTCSTSSIRDQMDHDGISNNNINSVSLSVCTSFQQMLHDESTRNALVVGCWMMILQQICGVNGVLYYAASIYEMAGFGELTSIWLSAFTAFSQIIGLAFSVVLIETAGRRVLVVTSLICIGVCSMGLGWSFYGARVGSEPVFWDRIDPECAQQAALVWDGITRSCWSCTSIPGCGYCGNSCVKGNDMGPFFGDNIDNTNMTMTCPAGTEEEWSYHNVCTNPYGWMSVVFMVLYLIVFGIGMAGLPWTINSEIYPVRFRSLAVSISTGTNWLCNLLVSSTFLSINSPAVLTSYGSFYMYGTICYIGAAAMYIYLPETGGLSPEQIQEAFRSGARQARRSHNSLGKGEREPLVGIHQEDGTFQKYGYSTKISCSEDTIMTYEEDSAASYCYGSVRELDAPFVTDEGEWKLDTQSTC